MFVFTFCRQSRIDPILFSSRVVAHVRVTHRRQFTGGRFGGMSRRAGAVNHDISVFLRQEAGSLCRYLIRRQIDCAGQVRMMIGSLGQSLYEKKLIFAINFLFQFVSGNRIRHCMPFQYSELLFGTSIVRIYSRDSATKTRFAGSAKGNSNLISEKHRCYQKLPIAQSFLFPGYWCSLQDLSLHYFAFLCASFASFAVNKYRNRKERKVAAKVRKVNCITTRETVVAQFDSN